MITWWQGDEKIIRGGGVWRKEAKVEAGKRTKCRLCISHLKHLLRKKTLNTWNEDGCHVEKLVSREMEFHFEAAVVSAPLIILRFKTIFFSVKKSWLPPLGSRWSHYEPCTRCAFSARDSALSSRHRNHQGPCRWIEILVKSSENDSLRNQLF